MTGAEGRLAMQAYERALDLILNRSLAPGEMVNERRLAETLNMSRTPVRDALLMLENEGLLLRQGSRGLQVRQVRIEDFMDSLQIRLLLEPEVARLAAGRVATAAMDGVEGALVDLAAQPADRPADRNKVRAVDEALHEMLAEAAGNPQMAQIIRNLRRRTLIFDLRSMPERLGATCEEHLAILRAVRAGDGPGAVSAMTTHLAAVRRSIIRRLTHP